MSEDALDRVQSARAILLDWDGCVVENGEFKPGAQAFLRAFGDKVSILSNNSTDVPGHLAAMLARAGTAIPEHRIHLAGQIALEETARRFGQQPIFLVGNTAMAGVATRLSLNIAFANDPIAVVLLRDTGFTYRKLERAVRSLRRGAALVTANPDLTHPKGDDVAPETGALLAAIAACVDLTAIDMVVVGKPFPTLFGRALADAGAAANEALMMGDNPATDAEGAARLGIASVLLGPRSGVTLQTIMDDPRARSCAT